MNIKLKKPKLKKKKEEKLEGEEPRIGKNKEVGQEGKKGHVGRKGVRTDYWDQGGMGKKTKIHPQGIFCLVHY